MPRESLPPLNQRLPKHNPGSLLLKETFPLDPQGSPKPTPHLPARKGGKGMTKLRDIALRKAHNQMTMLKAYAQSVANAEPEQVEAIRSGSRR